MMNKAVPTKKLFRVELEDEKFSIVHAADRKEAEIIALDWFGHLVQSVQVATAEDVTEFKRQGCPICYDH